MGVKIKHLQLARTFHKGRRYMGGTRKHDYSSGRPKEGSQYTWSILLRFPITFYHWCWVSFPWFDLGQRKLQYDYAKVRRQNSKAHLSKISLHASLDTLHIPLLLYLLPQVHGGVCFHPSLLKSTPKKGDYKHSYTEAKGVTPLKAFAI